MPSVHKISDYYIIIELEGSALTLLQTVTRPVNQQVQIYRSDML